ncbi:MAG: AAA family ATPase [Gimesia sp.]
MPGQQSEQRQITVLCCSLNVFPLHPEKLDLELLNTLQRDQLGFCADIGAKFGGYHVGTLGDSMMFYFGYPQASDIDTRHAARMALELSGRLRHRSAQLEQQQGIRLTLQIAIHTGMVLLSRDDIPAGLIPNIALQLKNHTDLGTILVSEPTRLILEQYIEFGPASQLDICGHFKPITTFKMVGERQTEALFFLREGSLGYPLIGRSKEFEQLMDTWKGMANGHGQTVLITGEAGIGKSRLTYEMRRFVREGGSISRECRCFPEYRTSALHPFLEMLKTHWRLRDTENKVAAATRLLMNLEKCDCKIEWSMPIFCAWLSLPLPKTLAPTDLSPNQQKKILFQVFEQLLFQIGEEASWLLIVEDLHWIDPTSLELLEHLIFSPTKNSCLLLLTTRPEFSPTWEYDHCHAVGLERLNTLDSEGIIQQIVGNRPIEKKTLSYLSERTDGIPLFLEELTHMLLDKGALIEQSGFYRLNEPFDQASIPITIQELLNARLDCLGVVKETIQIAAAIGREFDYDLLVKSSVRDEGMIQADLDQILATGLIFRLRRVQSERYIFHHALIRDAAYESMLKQQREFAHGRIATALEDYFPDQLENDPVKAAQHFAEATSYDKAVKYGLQAARTAVERSSNFETLELGNLIRKWNAEQGNSLEQKRTRLELVQIMFPAQMDVTGLGSIELVDLSKEIDALCDELEANEVEKDLTINENTRFLSQWIVFQDNHYRSRCHEAIALGEKIIFRACKKDNRQQQMIMLPQLAQAYQCIGNLDQARQNCEQALELFDDQKDRTLWTQYGVEPKSHALVLLSHILSYQGFPERAEVCTQKALEWSQEIGNTMSVDASIMYFSMNAFLGADKERVAEATKDYIQHKGPWEKDEWLVSFIKVAGGWARQELKYSRWFFDRMLSFERGGPLFQCLPMLLETEIELGKEEVAIELVSRIIAHCDKHRLYGILPHLKLNLAQALYARDQRLSSEIVNLLQQSAQSARQQESRWLELMIAYTHARFLTGSKRNGKVKNMLSSVLDLLTEGQNTRLYQQANDLRRKL